VHDDVDAPEAAEHRTGHDGTTFGSRYVGCDELFGINDALRPGPRGSEDPRTGLAKRRNHCFADAFGAAGDERPFFFKLQGAAHW